MLSMRKLDSVQEDGSPLELLNGKILRTIYGPRLEHAQCANKIYDNLYTHYTWQHVLN